MSFRLMLFLLVNLFAITIQSSNELNNQSTDFSSKTYLEGKRLEWNIKINCVEYCLKNNYCSKDIHSLLGMYNDSFCFLSISLFNFSAEKSKGQNIDDCTLEIRSHELNYEKYVCYLQKILNDLEKKNGTCNIKQEFK